MRSFIALAEHLHFGRAAAWLEISQPALSQQLSRLESELEAELVLRTSREVHLTPAGELFLEACRRTLAEAQRAAEVVRDASLGIPSRLVIGCLGAGANGPLPRIIKHAKELIPNLLPELRHYSGSSAQERDLRAGVLDLAVVRSIVDEQVIGTRRLLDESFVLFVPENHPLAQQSEVQLTQLSDADFVLWPREVGSAYYDLIVGGCQRAGFTPKIRAFGTSIETQLALVSAGLGVTLQAAANSSLKRDGVRCVPVRDDELSATLWLAYRRGRRTQTIDRFLASLDSLPEG